MRFSFMILSSVCLVTSASAAGVDDLLAANKAAMGGDAWNGKAALKLDYAYVGQGLKGTAGTTFDVADGRFVDRYDLGAVSGANGFDGSQGWSKDPSGTITPQNGGETLPLSVNEAYQDANLWWRTDKGGADIKPEPAKSDASTDAISVTPKDGKEFEAWFDKKTYLLARTFEQQGSSPVTSVYSDYRQVDGVMIAGKIVQSTGNTKYDQTTTLTQATFLPRQADSFFAAPANTVADFSISGGAHQTTMPFRLINNHIYADAMIDGKGPYTFIFDTGGENIVTPTVAKTLGLKVEGQIEARGAGSGTMEAGFTKVARLDLGQATIKDQPFGAFPLDALSDVEGLTESGMVGFETFRRFVTRIDYGTNTITLIDPSQFDPKDAGAPVPLNFDGNVTEISASYDGIPGRFQLDTGARSSLTLTAPFVVKHDLRTRAGKGVDAVTGWGVGGPTRSYAEHGGTLEIGDIRIASPVVELSTDTGGAMAEGDIAGNIGAGILKRFAITLDYGHNLVYFKPIEGKIADLDTFDRAGTWFNRDPKGFKVIAVTANAPAAEAGLKEGDIVTAVDGKPATQIMLYDLRYRLRNDPAGTHVAFTVMHGDATHEIDVVLRDLI